jgi:hypothetical protein
LSGLPRTPLDYPPSVVDKRADDGAGAAVAARNQAPSSRPASEAGRPERPAGGGECHPTRRHIGGPSRQLGLTRLLRPRESRCSPARCSGFVAARTRRRASRGLCRQRRSQELLLGWSCDGGFEASLELRQSKQTKGRPGRPSGPRGAGPGFACWHRRHCAITILPAVIHALQRSV